MKKLVTLLLALCMVLALVACGKTAVCDFCGKTKTCKQTKILGETVMICTDCQKELKNLGKLFG